MKHWILALALVLQADGFAAERFYAVSETSLDQLKRDMKRLEDKLADVQRAYERAFTDRKDRADFQSDMQKTAELVRGKHGLLDWVDDAKTHLLAEDPGPVAPPPAPKEVLFEIKGFHVIPADGASDRAEGERKHAEACRKTTEFWKHLIGDAFDSLECGTPENRAAHLSGGHFFLTSEATIKVKVLEGVKIGTSKAPPVTGKEIGFFGGKFPDLVAAYTDWGNVCQRVLRDEQSNRGKRFIGGTCGVPSEISAREYQYRSENGVIYIAE